jgi:hypothetical protein
MIRILKRQHLKLILTFHFRLKAHKFGLTLSDITAVTACSCIPKNVTHQCVVTYTTTVTVITRKPA